MENICLYLVLVYLSVFVNVRVTNAEQTEQMKAYPYLCWNKGIIFRI